MLFMFIMFIDMTCCMNMNMDMGTDWTQAQT